MKVENNCVHAVQESRVLLVCQHLFKCQKKNKNKIYANVYWNTINDGNSQTSLSPIFLRGGGCLHTGYMHAGMQR